MPQPLAKEKNVAIFTLDFFEFNFKSTKKCEFHNFKEIILIEIVYTQPHKKPIQQEIKFEKIYNKTSVYSMCIQYVECLPITVVISDSIGSQSEE